MRTISYLEAIREAIIEEMNRDPTVFFMGEDIAAYGGAFGVSKGLLQLFGPERVRNTPMSEAAITGVAAGAAIAGMRPIVEIMFMDFITLAMDQLLNHATQYRYTSNGQIKVPFVLRTPSGGGRGYGSTHSKSLEPLLQGIPGLKIVAPSTAYDAKGLLKAAIRDDNPIIFIENKLLYSKVGEVPEEEYILPLEQATIVREGSVLTVISYGKMLQESVEAVTQLGAAVEIIDLRTLRPIDIALITASVKKTGKVLIVEEGFKTGGLAAEITAQIGERCFDYLDAPIRRLASEDVPIPCTPILEQEVLPNKSKIMKAIQELL
ncbi:alpha-ketoacid dehydrogenase subunit beta [Candidatus Woesearchaeota archaeon]|nr:alpha-ketoacid dehydrogenase subunit beta [Candidatus Woesearchaeota archaeon]